MLTSSIPYAQSILQVCFCPLDPALSKCLVIAVICYTIQILSRRSAADGLNYITATRPEMYEFSEPFLDITLPGKDSPVLAYWDPKPTRIKYHCFRKVSNSKITFFYSHSIIVLLFCSSLTALSLTTNKRHGRLATKNKRKYV